jgi:dihydroxyacetone kinase-like protein
MKGGRDMNWGCNQVKEFLVTVARIMEENKDSLIELDSKLGDGDLGLTMSDGFKAAADAAQTCKNTDLGKLLYVAGKAMASAAPSTMGTLMAYGLIGAGNAVKGKTEIDSLGVSMLFRGWYDGVQKLGKAKPGEKTFLDGMLPAIEVLEREAEKVDAVTLIARACKAAERGAQHTAGMLSVHGRAAIRGEESRDILDPGAVVASLILKAAKQVVR